MKGNKSAESWQVHAFQQDDAVVHAAFFSTPCSNDPITWPLHLLGINCGLCILWLYEKQRLMFNLKQRIQDPRTIPSTLLAPKALGSVLCRNSWQSANSNILVLVCAVLPMLPLTPSLQSSGSASQLSDPSSGWRIHPHTISGVICELAWDKSMECGHQWWLRIRECFFSLSSMQQPEWSH